MPRGLSEKSGVRKCVDLGGRSFVGKRRGTPFDEEGLTEEGLLRGQSVPLRVEESRGIGYVGRVDTESGVSRS